MFATVLGFFFGIALTAFLSTFVIPPSYKNTAYIVGGTFAAIGVMFGLAMSKGGL